jgi:hypothetical protein
MKFGLERQKHGVYLTNLRAESCELTLCLAHTCAVSLSIAALRCLANIQVIILC